MMDYKRLILLFLVLPVAISGFSQMDVKVRIEDGVDEPVKQVIEKNATHLLSSLNSTIIR